MSLRVQGMLRGAKKAVPAVESLCKALVSCMMHILFQVLRLLMQYPFAAEDFRLPGACVRKCSGIRRGMTAGLVMVLQMPLLFLQVTIVYNGQKIHCKEQLKHCKYSGGKLK